MPPRRTDHGLRRMVADLAMLGSDDINAILDSLDTGERSRVERLLDTYVGKGGHGLPAVRPLRSGLEAAGLSPWLAERMSQDGGQHQGSMTAAAVAGLRDCARDLFASAVDRAEPSTVQPSLFGRIASSLVRRGRSA